MVVGRCADYVLRDFPNKFDFFIHGSIEDRIKRIQSCGDYEIEARRRRRRWKKMDKQRSTYYNYYTGKVWGKCDHYDMCINAGRLGVEHSVDIILEYVNRLKKISSFLQRRNEGRERPYPFGYGLSYSAEQNRCANVEQVKGGNDNEAIAHRRAGCHAGDAAAGLRRSDNCQAGDLPLSGGSHEVLAQLDYNGELTVTYPAYGDGWAVTAHPTARWSMRKERSTRTCSGRVPRIRNTTFPKGSA